jgi:hypothetical protein
MAVTLVDRVECSTLNIGAGAECRVIVDGVDRGATRVEFSTANFVLSQIEARLLGVAMGIIVAQQCFPSQLHIDGRLPEDVELHFWRLYSLFCASHCYTEARETHSTEMRWVGSSLISDICEPQLGVRKAVLLWSGGKDALASLEVLRGRGFDVVGLHCVANAAVAACERAAAVALAAKYDLPLEMVAIDWGLLDHLGSLTCDHWNIFPYHNSIPHGRDLVLLIAAALIARRIGASYVCAGYEFDLWDKEVLSNGRLIMRHDVQSRPAGVLVNSLLRTTLGVSFFSPIADRREFVILRQLLAQPDIWDLIESCFWGGWCGECSKCLRYRLVAEYLGHSHIAFRVDPFQSDDAYASLRSDLNNVDTPFWEEQVFALMGLHEKRRLPLTWSRDLKHHEEWFSVHRGHIERELLIPHVNDLAPWS